MSVPAHQDLDDPARHPRSLAQRLQLLLILLIFPIAAVMIPTIVVTGIFGQYPKPKISLKPTLTTSPTPPDQYGLGVALSRSAVALLPTPAPLTTEPIQIKVRPDHVAARAEKVRLQAQALGGSTVEGVSDPGEKHLFVDLPGGTAEAFHRALAENNVPSSPAASAVVGAAHDQLEVIVRPVADDE